MGYIMALSICFQGIDLKPTYYDIKVAIQYPDTRAAYFRIIVDLLTSGF